MNEASFGFGLSPLGHERQGGFLHLHRFGTWHTEYVDGFNVLWLIVLVFNPAVISKTPLAFLRPIHGP
jgi:hypothetical protein